MLMTRKPGPSGRITMKHLLLALVIALSALTARPTDAQVLYTLQSPAGQDTALFGWSLSGVGDVNGDGCPDLVVGAFFENVYEDHAGRAYVFDGSNGGLLQTLESPTPEEGGSLGIAVSGAGHVDNDGCDDVIAGAHQEDGGAYDAGRAYVFSGATGSLLFTLVSPNPRVQGNFGCEVSDAGDVDGDGHDDVAVAAHWEDGAVIVCGRAYVISGSTGRVIHALESPNPKQAAYFGTSLARVGDLDGDGIDDLAVGAYLEDGGALQAGRVYVFSGQDAHVIHTLESPYAEVTGGLGISVAALGDVDADGWPDVIVGAWLEDGGDTQAGRAYVFSGQTGAVLHTLESPNPEWFGGFGLRVAGIGDVNGDGCPDMAVGTYKEDGGAQNAGRAYVFSGSDGSLLYTLVSPNVEVDGYFGTAVSGLGDVNGDGRGEVVVGAYRENGGAWDAGRVYVFNGIEVPVELASFTCRSTDAGVLLNWVTYTETDNRGFHVCRSIEGQSNRHRVTEQLIPGAGTTTNPQTYSYFDPIRESGRYLYWLEQVDLNGATTRHGPVEAIVEPTMLRLDGPFPNPTAGEVRLTLTLPGEGARHVELRLYDAGGRLVARPLSERVVGAVSRVVAWTPESDLPPGAYWWHLEAGDRVVRKSMVLAR
jgi:hypothetical protein